MKTILVLLLIVSCGQKNENPKYVPTLNTHCEGHSRLQDEFGVIKKFYEYWHEGLEACVKESIPLTHFESSSRKRALSNIECSPQFNLPSLYLKAANHYYHYRNNRILLSLDAEAGIFKRITLGEDKDTGEYIFTRDIGCWFFREDFESEPSGNYDHGKQLLLDLENAASSSLFHPMEIFRINSESNATIELTRFDDNSQTSWANCPTSTPLGFCDKLRNGNIFYYPTNLDNDDKSRLKAEAILIRSEFNFEKISKIEFESIWNFHIKNSKESSLGMNWKYIVQGFPDVPSFIHRTWRNYIIGSHAYMPDVTSPKIPSICYTTAKRVTFDDGSKGFVKGEACYVDGEYIFTQL